MLCFVVTPASSLEVPELSVIKTNSKSITLNWPVSKLYLLMKYLHQGKELERAMPITPHANGEPRLRRSFSYSHFFPVSTILLVVWSANGVGSALPSEASSNLLNDGTY